MSEEPITVGEGENQLKLEPFSYWSFPSDAWCITLPKRAPWAAWSDWLALARKILERDAEQRGRDDFIDDAHRNSSELGKRKSP